MVTKMCKNRRDLIDFCWSHFMCHNESIAFTEIVRKYDKIKMETTTDSLKLWTDACIYVDDKSFGNKFKLPIRMVYSPTIFKRNAIDIFGSVFTKFVGKMLYRIYCYIKKTIIVLYQTHLGIRKYPNHVPARILFAMSNFLNLRIVSPVNRNRKHSKNHTLGYFEENSPSYI